MDSSLETYSSCVDYHEIQTPYIREVYEEREKCIHTNGMLENEFNYNFQDPLKWNVINDSLNK